MDLRDIETNPVQPLNQYTHKNNTDMHSFPKFCVDTLPCDFVTYLMYLTERKCDMDIHIQQKNLKISKG